MLKLGQIYKHYKGNLYQIVNFAKHTETMEDMIVYMDVADNSKVWARPRGMFEEKLADGTPRFLLVK